MQTVKVLRRIVTTRIEPGQPGPKVYEAGDVVTEPPGWLWRMAVSNYGRDGSGRKAPFAIVIDPPGPTAPLQGESDYRSAIVTDSNRITAGESTGGIPEDIHTVLSPAGIASLRRWMDAEAIDPGKLENRLRSLAWKELVRAAGGVANAKAVRICLENCK